MQARLSLNGADLLADVSGALFWPERGFLVVADLHFEKGSAYAARGTLLPPYDTGATLTALEAACARLKPAAIVALGDSFHDRAAADRVSEADGRRIAALTAAVHWTWIVGNHDPAPPDRWGGRVENDLVLGPLALRHEARPGPAPGEVSGHYHPKAAVPTRARRVTGRCFVSDGERLILPAFGAFTGGLNVCDPAIANLLAPDFTVWVMGRDRLFAFPRAALAADAPTTVELPKAGRRRRGA